MFSKEKISKVDITDVYISSNLAKYLPGNVMQYVGRNVLGTKYKINQSNMIIATILELMGIIFASITIILLFSYKQLIYIIKIYANNKLLIKIFIIAIICLIIAFGILIKKFEKSLVIKLKSIDFEKIKKILPKWFMLDILVQLGTSITFFLVVKSFIDTNSGNLFFNMMGIYLTAWLIGFVIPGAPGGIGVKEYILIVLLTNLIPSDIILISVTIHRVLNIIAEILAFAVNKIIRIFIKSEEA